MNIHVKTSPSDDIIGRARARLAEIERERAFLEAEREELETAIAVFERLMELQPVAAKTEPIDLPAKPTAVAPVAVECATAGEVGLPASPAPLTPPVIAFNSRVLELTDVAKRSFFLRNQQGEYLDVHMHGFTRLPAFYWRGTESDILKLKKRHPKFADLTERAVL